MLLHARILAVRVPFAKQALSWESIVFSSHSEKFHTQNLLLWPPAIMKMLLRAISLAVRGAYTEQALWW